MPSYGIQPRYAGSTPPCSMRSSISRPTGLSASAVTIAVRRPKQRRSPRATLYSPPPSQTSKLRVVAMRRSPGSSRSITSPSATRSQRQASFARRFIGRAPPPRAPGARPRRSGARRAAGRRRASSRRTRGPTAGPGSRQRRRVDAAGRHEPDVRIDGAHRLDEAGAAERAGGEELDHVAAECSAMVDLGRRRGAGNEGQLELGARVDDLVVRPRGDRERRACVTSQARLCAESTVPAPTTNPSIGARSRDRLGRGLGTKGDLRHDSPPRGERSARRLSRFAVRGGHARQPRGRAGTVSRGVGSAGATLIARASHRRPA